MQQKILIEVAKTLHGILARRSYRERRQQYFKCPPPNPPPEGLFGPQIELNYVNESRYREVRSPRCPLCGRVVRIYEKTFGNQKRFQVCCPGRDCNQHPVPAQMEPDARKVYLAWKTYCTLTQL